MSLVEVCTSVVKAQTVLRLQGNDGTASQYGSEDSSNFINKIVSCVLDKQMLPYSTNAVYFVLTSPEVNINGPLNPLHLCMDLWA